MTAKHRIFTFESAETLTDQGLVPIATDDAFFLGLLSSTAHLVWALASGGTLEDRPRYNQSRCFETFPFPTPTPDQQTRIRELAEQLDAHRKRQQAQHPTLTLTGIYNVLQKIRAFSPLTAKDKLIHEQGLVSVLQTLHDELDRAVLQAYGWQDLLPSPTCGRGSALPLVGAGGEGGHADEILTRLVALNSERAREEAGGVVRWLRPGYQNPAALSPTPLPQVGEGLLLPSTACGRGAGGEGTPTSKTPWPATLPEQMALLAALLKQTPLSETAIAAQITGKGPWKKRLPDLLQTLVALGRARQDGETWVAV